MTTPFISSPFNYQGCVQVNDPVLNKRLYQTPDGESLPSVTTILGATADKSFLMEWRKKVGEDRAKQITSEASGRGSAMHNNLENYVLGKQRQAGSNLVHVIANRMADVIIKNAFPHINCIWAIEQSLYYPGLYAGTADLIAEYNSNPSICDYKQSNKLKTEEQVEDYRLQIISYALAHNEVYGTNIKEGHIFLCTKNLEYQQFDLLPSQFSEYEDKWFSRVEKYYSNLLEGEPGMS